MLHRLALQTLVLFVVFSLSACAQHSRFQYTPAAIELDTLVPTLRFMVIGDWGRNGENHQTEVGDMMDYFSLKYKAQFIVSTGDNFYNNGVTDVQDPLWKSSFESIYAGKGLQIPWYVVLGNHDHRGSPAAEMAYHTLSPRWNLPGHYYAKHFLIGGKDSAQLVFFDSSPLVKEYWKQPATYKDLIQQDTARQLQWIDSAFSHSPCKWKIAIGHHPFYSAALGHGNTPELIASLKPILLKNGVQVSFAGHEHDLQHLQVKGEPLAYFISGAGSKIGFEGRNELSLYEKAIPGFAFVSLSANRMQVFFISYEGKLLYQTAIPVGSLPRGKIQGN